MDFNSFLTHISSLKAKPLGGIESQFKMAPDIRKELDFDSIIKPNAKSAAVLALFYPNQNGETHFLLTERASYNGTHSAQISFPGGKIEEQDTGMAHTALRETYEETAVPMHDVSIVKELTKTYIPPSNFWVSPFIGTIDYHPKFTANHEVSTLIEVKLKDVLDDASVVIKNMSTSYMERVDVPCFKLNNYIIWGATAMILSEIKDYLK
jgi:8-oxo-dGTP pyrophosphatase MutT (NUDIX family)